MQRLSGFMFFFLLCALFLAPVSGQEKNAQKVPADIDKLLRSAGGLDRYPDADIITVFERVNVDFKANGDSSTREQGLIKILTENGKKSYASLEYPYHRRYQEVIVEMTRVIYPDGTYRDVPADAVKDVTSSETQQMNIFEENFRSKTVTLPNLTVGCSIEYITTLKAKALLKDNYTDEFMFQGGNPILEKKVTIVGPAGRPLGYIIKNGTLSFTQAKNENTITSTWEARQVPQIIPEPGMVPISDVATKLTVSTYKSWQEISRYGHSLNEGKTDMNPALREEIKKLTTGLSSEKEKILAIFRFVSQKIRYMGSSMDVGAFIEPHQATYTFEKQYGICRDKSVLVMAMLKEIGIECRDVLINVTTATEKEVPTIYFQHAICAVILKDGTIVYMDPTLELSSSFGETYVGDHHVLLLSKEGEDLKMLPSVPAEKSMGIIESRTAIDAAGTMTGELKVSGKGYYDLVLRSINQEYPALQFERMLSRLGTKLHPRTAVSDVQSSNPVDLAAPYSFSLKLTTKDYAMPAGNFLLFPLPLSSGTFDLVVGQMFYDLTRLKERKYPMGLFSTCGCLQRDRLTLPEGYRVVSLPPSLSVTKGPLSLSIRIKQNGREIVFESDYRIEKSRLSPAEYGDLRKVGLDLKKFGRTMVILEKIQ